MTINNNLRRHISLQFILFIFFFGCLTCFINSNNTVAFGLQQRGIESIVERGNIYLDTPSDRMEHYTSNFTWDTFSYKNHAYLAKQPGQFFLGSIVYLFLYKLGMTYANNSMLVCGLIALFTSSLMVALMMVMIFNIFFKIIRKKILAFIATCFFGFGTLILPYAGILQHDICATFFLFSSFYFLFSKYHLKASTSRLSVIAAGFFCGFSSFFSNNIITIVFILFLYVVCKRNWKDVFIFAFSFLVGLLPIFVFNYYVFGHPFNFSINLYAKFFNQSHEITLLEYLPSILKRIDLYLISPITAITFYSPIYLLSYCGLLLLPKKYSIEKAVLLLVFILQFFQPSLYGIAGYGWCQYGPRYLIESIPFTLIGLSGFFVSEKSCLRTLINKYQYRIPLILLMGIISIVICSVGTLGVIYCGYYDNAFLSYAAKIISGKNLPNYYLLTPGITILLFSFILLFIKNPGTFKATLNELGILHKEHGVKWLYLTTIILLGLYLRTTRLDELPIGLSADEASIGYNAYSISKIGLGENGEILPVFFNSLTGAKSPLIVYLSALLLKLLGPSIFSLRLTSSLLGIITIFFTYKLTNLYFSKSTALLASFLLSISPWHIQFSRFSNESISFSCFFILGLYLLILGLQKKDEYIILSSIPISLAFYSYESAIIFLLLFFICFVLLNIKCFLKKRQAVVTSLLIIAITLSPLIQKTFEAYKSNKSITNQNYLENAKSEFKSNNLSFLSSYKSIFISSIFLRNYFKYMSTDFFLTNKNKNYNNSTHDRGQLLLFTFLMGIIGFIYLILKKQYSLYIFPLWFLIFPISASLDPGLIPDAAKSICALPIFEILASLGFISILVFTKKLFCENQLKTKNAIKITVVCLFVLFITIRGISDFRDYLRKYFEDYNLYASNSFSYNSYAIAKATENLKEYDNFVLPFDFYPEIFLYLHKIDPKQWIVDKSVLRFITNAQYDAQKQNYTMKKLARIAIPGSYQDEETIGYVYKEQNNEVIYEIKKIKPLSLVDKKTFSPQSIGGLKGEYFNGRDFNNLKMTRIDKTINFNWEWGSPDSAINNDNFSVRWTGWVNILEAGKYKFISKNDDGIKLSIDNSIVIDDWYSHPIKNNEGDISLNSEWHQIEVKFFEDTSANLISLEWQKPDGSKETIPSNLLSPDPIYK